MPRVPSLSQTRRLAPTVPPTGKKISRKSSPLAAAALTEPLLPFVFTRSEAPSATRSPSSSRTTAAPSASATSGTTTSASPAQTATRAGAAGLAPLAGASAARTPGGEAPTQGYRPLEVILRESALELFVLDNVGSKGSQLRFCAPRKVPKTAGLTKKAHRTVSLIAKARTQGQRRLITCR